jgi:hypothetical protein
MQSLRDSFNLLVDYVMHQKIYRRMSPSSQFLVNRIYGVLITYVVWQIKKDKRYICVGTWGHKLQTSGETRGRLLVYTLKLNDRKCSRNMNNEWKYRFRKMGEKHFDSPISCCSSFINR